VWRSTRARSSSDRARKNGIWRSITGDTVPVVGFMRAAVRTGEDCQPKPVGKEDQIVYNGIKHLHMLLAVVSLFGFVLRGAWMLRDSPLLQQRVVRVLPHVVDTLLLATAVALAVMSAQYPLVTGWVTAKVVGLIAYIVLGVIAL